ncbi:MAG: hypothetical protein NZ934_02390 [Hadesarchaea archaeon]|nr:hypothetical protein [Hadesarchaea archaeon]
MNSKVKSVALDFVFGGAIVAGALFVASLLGPLYGGLLAGAPIRAGGTVFLASLHRGEEFAREVARGVMLAMVANVGFAIVLYFCLPKLGMYKALAAASLVFLVLVVAMARLRS